MQIVKQKQIEFFPLHMGEARNKEDVKMNKSERRITKTAKTGRAKK